MRVRRADGGDLPALEQLVASCADAPVWPRRTLDGYLAAQTVGEPLARVLLVAAKQDQSFAGMIAITLIGQTTELELLLVPPEFRRQGIARLLSRAWLDWATQAAAQEALLEVRASNMAAQRLYQQLGFTVEGRRPGYYREPEEDALLMRKSLGA